MDHLLQVAGDLKPVIWSVVLIAGVIIFLGTLNRFLNRESAQRSGHRFRNQLIMSGALFLSLLVIILGLPMDATKQGQLLGLIGIIISAGIALSSSTILGNAMAGIMLKTVRNFQSGDFVEVEDFFGRVSERGLFHTEIQTADRDLVTLPNMYLATHPVRVVRRSGTVISATLSLGYDIPQARIKELLLKAAADIGLKEPFVQVLELGDFSVLYRVAGLLEESKKILTYRSRLRSSVLDVMHQGGVEIVSPQFMNVRDFDPHQSFIPSQTRTPRRKATDAAPAEVVFDKAEVAATLSTMENEQTQVGEELKAAQQAVKDAKEEKEKQDAEQEVAKIESRLARIDETINEVRDKEKELDDQ